MVAASSAGHSGAASATWEHVHRHFGLRGRSAVLSPNAAMYVSTFSGELHVDFDLTAAWRHHVSMPPSVDSASLRGSPRSQEVHASFSETESSDCAKSHTGGFWGAVGPLTAARRTVPPGAPAPPQRIIPVKSDSRCTLRLATLDE